MNLSTFSIVARDKETGFIGVAGGTNWFNYGRWVPHISAGFGALATQAETNMWYAPNGIADLETGLSAKETVEDMLNRDPDKSCVYQLLVIDNKGNTFCHTGEKCHFYAGHICEENLGVTGNTLVSEETLTSMVSFFKGSILPFSLKLIKTLQEGQKAGGDIRGMKSAAIKVAKAQSSGKYWNDIVLDLRVDENKDPLKELEHLYIVSEAYKYINNAESISDPKEVLKYYQEALKLDPDNAETMFWMAKAHNTLGNVEKVSTLREKIRAVSINWDEYWKRLDNK